MKSIFISSTFRDMQAERDALAQIVLPDVAAEAAKHQEDIDFIDLRWGVDTTELESEGGAVCLTGGLCECEYIVRALSDTLKKTIVTRPEARYAGAVGAALAARKMLS